MKKSIMKMVNVAIVAVMMCTLLDVSLNQKRYVTSVESGTVYVLNYKDRAMLEQLLIDESGFVKIPKELDNYDEEQGIAMTDGKSYKSDIIMGKTINGTIYILKKNTFNLYQHKIQKEP